MIVLAITMPRFGAMAGDAYVPGRSRQRVIARRGHGRSMNECVPSAAYGVQCPHILVGGTDSRIAIIEIGTSRRQAELEIHLIAVRARAVVETYMQVLPGGNIDPEELRLAATDQRPRIGASRASSVCEVCSKRKA